MSVLVDTSVWIRFLAGKEPYASALDRWLEKDAVVGHELIYGELLVGDIGGRKALLSAYAVLDHAPTVPHTEVVEFVRSRKLHGKGVGWVDIHLVAAALVAGVPLWTADPRLELVASEVGASFRL